MALLKQLDIITGSIGKVTMYTRKGSDKIFMRTKGGASKEKIKQSPAFANVRRNNKEFGGCSKMSKHIRYTFGYLAHVADYNISSALCAIAKMIQKNDGVGAWGERKIELSKYRNMIQGFEFNHNNRFSSILRIPLEWKIEREKQEATINLPVFDCSYGLYLPGNFALFRITAGFGVVSDLQLGEQKYGYEPTHGECVRWHKTVDTNWYSTKASVPAQKLVLNISGSDLDFANDDTLVLTIVIEFGSLDGMSNPIPIKHAGAGMILGVR